MSLEAYSFAGEVYHIDCALESDTLASLARPVFDTATKYRGKTCPTCGEVVSWLLTGSLFLVRPC